MGMKAQLNTLERSKRLTKALEEMQEIGGFSDEVLNNYKTQLKEAKEELEQDKERKIKFRQLQGGIN